MTVAELKTLRDSTGLSQESFGVLVLGVSGRTVARWESGASRINDLSAAGIKAKVTTYLMRQK